MEFFFFPGLGMFPTKSANKALQYDGLVFRKYWREGGEFPFLDELYLPISSIFQWKERKRLGEWQMFHFDLLQSEKVALEIPEQVLLIFSKWKIFAVSFRLALH